MKANEMHYFSNLFHKLHVSDRSTVHHQEYLNTVYTQYIFVRLDKYLLLVYSVEILLVMDSGSVRNM